MFHQKLLLTLLLLIFSQASLFILKAQAGLLGNYKPSSEPIEVEQRRTVGSGSRSSCKSNLPPSSIALIVPEAKVVHKTSSPTPSLFLRSTVASTLPFKFILVDPSVDQSIVEKTFSIEQPGIKQIELPSSTKLEVGKVYLWYVAIPCQRDPKQYQEILTSAIVRVPASTEMTRQLQQAGTISSKAVVYARAGFWYEAVELAVRDRSNYLQQLLANAGLRSSR